MSGAPELSTVQCGREERDYDPDVTPLGSQSYAGKTLSEIQLLGQFSATALAEEAQAE